MAITLNLIRYACVTLMVSIAGLGSAKKKIVNIGSLPERRFIMHRCRGVWKMRGMVQVKMVGPGVVAS